MTKQQRLFIQTCRALWGPQWQSAAIHDLALSRSSLVRYANGGRAIPKETFELLERCLQERMERLIDLQPKLAEAVL